VQRIPIGELHEFKGHPFQVRDDEEMDKTAQSIKEYGITTPLLVRPDPGGGFEIISGHRRHHAAELSGLDAVPCIIREMDDDTAVITMVDSNLQRETILPSERAYAYKMKMEAIRHQGERTDLTSTQVVSKLAAEQVGEDAGMSRENVRRYVRLTNLIPEVMDMVDEKKIALNPAVELSYLKPQEQKDFLEAMDFAQASPSLSQAQRMKKLSQSGDCTLDAMCGVMDEVKKDDMGQIAFKTSEIQRYFPKSYTPRQMSDTIIRLLEQYQRRRERDQQR
jgi:ParB family chromosome partitioning protein